MKTGNGNDVFLNMLYRKRTVRRRMLSLLLVLSLFVTSGVSWALRGVGITMANEPECGIEEHVHTADCYETQLVCGMEEDETHTHTEECYADVLVCGMEEHIHDAGCYAPTGSGSLFSAKRVTLDEAINQAESIDADIDMYDETEDVYLSSMDDEDSGGTQLRAAGDSNNDIYLNEDGVYVVNTIDNIAEGIHFTLFDYGDSNLESQLNHYGYRNNGDGNPFTHPNANTSSGINTDRNPAEDILFLAYGTPVPYGTTDTPAVDGGVNVHNYIDSNGVHQYQPDMNSYSGDYNQSTYYSGNRPVSGIVAADLPSNGYPVIATSGHSLEYLFSPETTVDNVDMREYKTVYQDVNHLLREEITNNGVRYLKYNSNRNYAYYDQSTGNFIVYADDPNTTDIDEGTFEIINDNHHYAGDINNIKNDSDGNPIVYSEPKDPGFKIGFFPFDEYDETRRDPNYDGNGYNHHFGMTMNAKFANPVNPTEPITFKYSGDDDMWVYVDGRLVLDIGGIHEPTSGMIDFTNGLVWVQDNGTGLPLESTDPNVDTVEKQVQAWGLNLSDLPKPIGINTAGTSVDEVNRWKVTKIETYFTDDKPWIPNKEGGHEINMFYLERGGCYSNLAMEMNLPTLKPLNIIKNVDYQQHLVKDPEIDDKEYWFQVWEWKDNKWQKPTDPQFNRNGVEQGKFSLKDGERKTFKDLDQTKKYKVVELSVDSSIYGQVTVNNGTPNLLPNGSGEIDVSSSENPITLSDVNNYIFNNQVREETTSISVQKVWNGANPPGNAYPIMYKIIRTDENGEEKQIALVDPVTNTKQRIFTLNATSSGNEIATHTGLLKQYGNHTYTYRVEEMNCPEGFKASYSYDENGNATITNTDDTKFELHALKKWEHVPTDEEPEIRLVLKRKKVKKLGSGATTLTVNILDEAGNLIQSKQFANTENGESILHIGGSTEISFDLPKGCELYHYEGMTDTEGIDTTYPTLYPQRGPIDPDKPLETPRVKFEPDENIVTVSNLQPSNNVVSFKVTTGYEKDDLLLLHHPFTRSTYDWGVQNDPSKQSADAKIGNISDSDNNNKGYAAYAKGDAMIVYNIQKSFNGATLTLDPGKFMMNKTYTFSTYVFYDDIKDDNGNAIVTAPNSVQFNFTFNDGLNKENNGSFRNISSTRVNKGQWTQLVGTISLPAEIDPYNMFIVVETANANGDESPVLSEFLVDEFTAIEGTSTVTVSRQNPNLDPIPDPGGLVSVGGASTTVYNDVYNVNFNSVLPDSWNQNGSPDLSVEGNAVRVSNRRNNSDGIQRDFTNILEAGHTYRFELGAQHDYDYSNNTAGADNIHMVLQFYDQNSDQFQWLCNMTLPDSDNDHTQWATRSQTFPIPSTATINNEHKARIYFETQNDTRAFRLRYLKITEITNVTTPISGDEKDGYEIIQVNNVNDHYLTDYSNYELAQVPNTTTNPQHLATDDDPDNFTVEEYPNNPIVLNKDTGWTFSMDKATRNVQFQEDDGYYYEYWFEEVSVGGSEVNNPYKENTYNGTTYAILNTGSTDDILTADGEYLVTYSNNFVPTNDSDHPVIITNKAIWYRLPPTGGIGADIIYEVGLVLILIGFTGGYAVKKRERRYK